MTGRAALSLLVALVAAFALLSGCFSGPLSDEEAAQRAELAVAAFATAMSEPDDGKIKSLKGSMKMQSPEGGEEFDMGFSNADIQMEMLWGQEGIVKFTVSSVSGGITFTVTAYCTPTKTILVWGSDVYESRAAGGDEEEICSGLDEGEEAFEDSASLFSGEEFAELDQVDVTAHDDGTITAQYIEPEGNATFTFKIDKKGRIVRMEMTSAEGNGAFDITYGARERITVPAATDRIPASLWWDRDFDAGMMTGTISGSSEGPALTELELRVRDSDRESDDESVLASFPVATMSGTQNGWNFTYNDADGNGRATDGDTFTLGNPAWEFSWDYEVEFYDTWAQGYVNESPLPAPGLVPILGLLVAGLAFVAYRRRQ